MDPNRRKIQSPKDYEIRSSKAMVPLTPKKSDQQISNRYSPLQNRPEIPFNTVLVSNLPKPVNIQIPNTPEPYRYIPKEWFEDLGMTPFTEIPSDLVQRDFIRNKFLKYSQLWESDNFGKDQRYYEFILIDSQSVDISHNFDKANVDIEYSKCIIKRIHTLSTFGGIREFKPFSVEHPEKGYNYIDYKNAWFRAFLMRPFNHSWFFSFHSKPDKQFPTWFFDWWRKFGSSIQITPNTIQKGFNVFAENSTIKNFQKSALFHAEFKVPWIFAWDFQFRKIYPDPTPYSLVRIFKIKWWAKFQENLCSEDAVRHFLTTGEKLSYQNPNSKKGKDIKKEASTSKMSSDTRFSSIPDNLKEDFLEFLAHRSSSSKAKSEESVSSDPIGGQDPFDF